MRALYLSAASIVVMLVASPVAGQEQTGGVRGVVKDISGAVLVGVKVEARSPAVVGTSTAVTDSRGAYRFPALPPAPYTITASMAGFTPAASEAIIALGQTLTIDLVLQTGAVGETVVVTARSPIIDVKQNAAFATINRDLIDRFGGGRDFTAVAGIAPGVRNESRVGGIQMDGSTGPENRYVIDGMDTTNLQSGLTGKTMQLDFIQEVQVKSSGYNAEFGGSTGGVISAITKSGSNRFRGSAGFYNQGDWGYGDRRPYHRFAPYTITGKGVTANYTPEGGTCATTGMLTSLGFAVGPSAGAGAVPACAGPSDGLLAPDTPWRYVSPVADLGGPAIRDRLWFYAGWAYTRNDYQRDAIFYNQPATDASAPNGGRDTKHFEWYDWHNFLNYNVTGQVGHNLRLKFSGSNQRDRSRRAAPGLQPDNDPFGFPDGTPMKGYTTAPWPKLANGTFDQVTWDQTYTLSGGDGWNNTYTGNVDWVVTPNFFINATAGYFFYNNTTPPEARGNTIRHLYARSPCGLLDVPASYCQPANWSDATPSNGVVRNIFDRAFVNANATFFKSLAGQHTFKAGLRFERVGNDVYQGSVYPTVSLAWGQTYRNGPTIATGRYGYYRVSTSAIIGDVHSNNFSVWLQDTWSINNKLTINAGVRAENELIPNYKQGVPDCAIAPTDPDCAVSIKFGMGDKIAPRLGFAYDIKGDSKWKLYGSYSWYYDIMKLDLPRSAFGAGHVTAYVWTLDTYDFSTIMCEGPADSGCPGHLIAGVADLNRGSNQPDPTLAAYFNRPGMTGIDPGLRPMQTGDFQLGMDHELNPTMSVGARYIHKWMTRAVDDVGIYAEDVLQGGWGEFYLIANPGEGYALNVEPRYPDLVTPKPKRNYDAFELHLRKRLSNNWAAQVYYTYSRLYGNYSGLASSDEFGRASPNLNRAYDNTVMSYDPRMRLVYGRLNSDRPHQFHVVTSYDFSFGTSVSAFFVAESGLPNSTVFRAGDGAYPVFPNGRNDLPRLQTYYNLDLMLRHDVKLGGNRRLELQASFENVLDLKRVTNWYYEQYGSTLFRNDSVALPITYFYTPYNLADAVTLYQTPIAQGGYSGALWDNAFFMVPDQYSSRRAIRLSAKFTF